MIIHIDLWLEELRRLHAEFNRACAQNDAFAIERTLYYSALVMRKFSETPYVRRGFLSPLLKGHMYGPPSGRVDGNRSKAPPRFDLMHGKPAETSLADLCNILIHSRFLQWSPAVGEVKQIFVAGGARADEAIGFTPPQYAKLLQHVEDYKFKRLPLRPVRRAGCNALP